MENKELTLEEKARMAKAAYMKAYMKSWREKNSNKSKEYQKRSWARKYDKMQSN